MNTISSPEPDVLAIAGEVDLHRSPEVKERLNPLIEQKRPSVVVDLSEVSYIDSSGLALLIEAMQRVQSYGGKLALCGIRENVKAIFEIARLDQVFRIFPDVSAARAGL